LDDRVTVRLPDRAWAECAREDLLAEGLCVQLCSAADDDGLWALDVSGCAEKIRAIRQSLEPAPPPFDWAACVNEWLGAPR
jgi:hypothetical protein